VATLVTLTVGLMLWIAGWALGVKSFDAFLLTVFMVVVAATARIYAPYVRQMLGKDTASPAQMGTGERTG
jgi:cytochrome b subunit of formate dehydrogenase